MHSFYKMIYVI